MSTLLKPELVLECKCDLGEGPVWHDDALWFVNINAGELHRFDPKSGAHEFKATADNRGGTLGAAIPCVDGHWLLVHRDGFALYEWDTGLVEPIGEMPDWDPQLRLNDAKADPSGRVWAGTMHTRLARERAALYRLDHDHTITEQVSKVSLSNGLAWSADGSRMFYIDTLSGRVDVFDFDANAPIPHDPAINRRTLHELGKFDGSPDGMTIDIEDNLWVALWGGSKLIKVDGRTGEQLDEIPMPVSQPTSCCFGGDGLGELYITSARAGLTGDQLGEQPHAGGVFRVELDIGGRAVQKFGRLSDH